MPLPVAVPFSETGFFVDGELAVDPSLAEKTVFIADTRAFTIRL